VTESTVMFAALVVLVFVVATTLSVVFDGSAFGIGMGGGFMLGCLYACWYWGVGGF
jgi:hypothetical protein